MNKIIAFGIAFTLAASSAFAAVQPKKQLSDEEIAAKRAAHQKMLMEKHGGLIRQNGTPSGKIVVVNGQNKVATADFEKAGESATSRIKGLVSFEDGEAADVKTATALKANAKADFAIFIVDNPELPMSLIATEAQWAICNIAPLKDGVKDDLQLKLRAQAEFMRVFGILCGGASSQFQASRIMNGIAKPSDLDGVTPELPVDILTKFTPYLSSRGLKPERLTIYRKACQEGWAPQPTNSFQKAVWDEVHALPTKPIKIKYDAKKGE